MASAPPPPPLPTASLTTSLEGQDKCRGCKSHSVAVWTFKVRVSLFGLSSGFLGGLVLVDVVGFWFRAPSGSLMEYTGLEASCFDSFGASRLTFPP